MNYFYHPGIQVTAKEVISICEKAFDITPGETLKKTRKREIKDARQLAMFFIHKHLGYTQTKTGQIFLRDHSTVHHAVDCIKTWIGFDKHLRDKFKLVAIELKLTEAWISENI